MKPCMLIVDDSAFMRLRMKKVFQDLYEIIEAEDGEECLSVLLDSDVKIDLILLDINMPKLDGISVLKILKQKKEFEELPIIVFSTEEEMQLEALKNGAWDFVAKEENPQILRTRIKNVLERSFTNKVKKENNLINSVILNIINNSQDLIFEWNLKNDKLFFIGTLAESISPLSQIFSFTHVLDNGRFIYKDDINLFKQTIKKITPERKLVKEELRIILKSGNVIWCKFTFYGEFDSNDELIRIVSIAADVNDLIVAIDNANKKAEHDPLTNLVNRSSFQNFYGAAMKKNVNSAMLLIDVDNFKNANDTLGHIGGDLILQVVAKRLRSNFRARDCVARIGGDEFSIIMVDIANKFNLLSKLDNLLEVFKEPIDVYGVPYTQFVSIGVLYIPANKDVNFLEAYKIADDCLYKSKEKGKNTYTVIEKE